MHGKLVGGAGVLALAVAVAGCGSSNGGGGGGSSTSKSTPTPSATASGKKVGAPGAKVAFVKPKDGASVGRTVTAKVKISGFELSPKTVGKPPKQGQGHLHFSMDGGKFDQPKYSGPNGKLAVTLGVNGKYSPAVAPTITYKGLPKGKHKLEVYLANNDHSNTGVEAETEFTAK